MNGKATKDRAWPEKVRIEVTSDSENIGRRMRSRASIGAGMAAGAITAYQELVSISG